MKTLNLVEAAEFLKMHPQTVRRLAKEGKIPAAKPGKHWCFIEDDLAAYLRSLYSHRRQVPEGQEDITQWHYLNVNGRVSGGSVSPSADGKYADLLGLPTKR